VLPAGPLPDTSPLEEGNVANVTAAAPLITVLQTALFYLLLTAPPRLEKLVLQALTLTLP